MIKMIATDIDGTILKHNFSFNPTIVDYIKTLDKNGIKVCLVTGRMHCAAQYIADKLGLKTPIVSYQGGLIRENENTLFEKYLDVSFAQKIIKWSNENKIHLNLYMNDELYVENDDETVKRYTDDRNAAYHVTPFSEVKLDKINKILAIDYSDADRVTSWIDYLSAEFPELYIVKSTPYFCEISHPDAKKSTAVDFLINHYGFKKEEVLTIGDQNNDIELLKAGGIKVAMGNATDELKEIADFITDTVDNDGFIKAVEKFTGGKHMNKGLSSTPR